jgi:hypothetical protein
MWAYNTAMISIAPNGFIFVAPLVIAVWASWYARGIVRGEIPVRAWVILLGSLILAAWFFG